MKLNRILALIAALAAPAALAQEVRAPDGPVHVIVPYGAGSFSDIIARKVADELGRRSGLSITVENVVGAGGVVGTQAIARGKADGTMLGLIASNHAMNAAIHTDLTYDPVASFVPVANVTYNPFVIAVSSEVAATTLAEYLDAARAEPGVLTYGSAGVGSSPHLAIEKLVHMAGVQLKHIPYRETGQMLNDLVGGRIGMVAYSISPLQQHIAAGTIRPLAVTGKTESALLPGVPPVAASGVEGYDMVNWNGFLVPAGTPDEIVAFYATEIAAIVGDPTFQQEVEALGATIEYLGPEAFAARISTETAYWKALVDETGIKVE